MYAVTLVDTNTVPPRVVADRKEDSIHSMLVWFSGLDQGFYGALLARDREPLYHPPVEEEIKLFRSKKDRVKRQNTTVPTGYVLCIEGPIEEGPQAA